MSHHLSRRQSLIKRLQPDQAILLANPSDIEYLTDFRVLVPAEREAFLLMTQEATYLFFNSLCPICQQPEIQYIKRCDLASVTKHLATILPKHQIKELLLDEQCLTIKEYKALLAFKTTLSGFEPSWLWQQRLVKEPTEQRLIQTACQIAQQAFQTTIAQHLHPGITEQQLAIELEFAMQKAGAQGPAFPTIVAFGEHTSLPHHQPTNLALTSNTPVLIDFGAQYQSYCSDMTRSWWFTDLPEQESRLTHQEQPTHQKQPPSDDALQYQKIDQVVKQAYQAVIDKLKTCFEVNELTLPADIAAINPAETSTVQTAPAAPALAAAAAGSPLTAQNLDQAARQVITQAGYQDYFIHTTGHGLGLDIHEPPSLSWQNSQPIQKGMTITIEPGIYFPERWGYRYENTVLLT